MVVIDLTVKFRVFFVTLGTVHHSWAFGIKSPQVPDEPTTLYNAHGVTLTARSAFPITSVR